MRWLIRLVWPFGRDDWPMRPPPTVPTSGRPTFHCPACKTPVSSSEATCARCGASLREKPGP